MPAQSNATVTAVTGQGVPDDWDTAAVAGAAKWAGQARAYYRETLVELRGNGTVTPTLRRELVLDYADVDAMALDTDDVITFALDGDPAPRTAQANTIPRKLLGGIPRALQTSRIILEDVG
jgi:hypothetical protein